MTTVDERSDIEPGQEIPVEPYPGLAVLFRALSDHEAADPRALQEATGASQAMGCRAEELWRLVGWPETDVRLRLDSLFGKAMHSYIERAITELGRTDALVEHRAVYRKVPCTIDLVLGSMIVDWKAPRLSKIAAIKKDGVPAGYRHQVHLGAAAMIEQGHPIDTVCLVFIPRDGDFEDTWEWSEPFDRAMADVAADRVAEGKKRAAAVKRLMKGHHDPDVVERIILDRIADEGLRDQDWSWCKRFCPRMTACRGPERVPPEPPDAGTLEAAQQFAAAVAMAKEAKLLKEEYGPRLDGYKALAIEDVTIRRVGGNPRTVVKDDMESVRVVWEALYGEIPQVASDETTAEYLQVYPRKKQSLPRR